MSASDDDPGSSAGWRRRQAQSDEAAEWFIRLRDDALSLRQRREAVDWLKQSPEHIAELLRVQQVYSLLRNVGIQQDAATATPPTDIATRRVAGARRTADAAVPEVAAAAVAAVHAPQPQAPQPTPAADGGRSTNVIELRPMRRPWLAEPPELPAAPPVAAPARPVRRQRLLAAAACMLMAVMAGFFVKATVLDRTLRVALGEWREVTLQDGSMVRAGPGSLLRFSFGDDHRTVRLMRGEAMFDVAKDPTRPFYVQAEVVGVLAVGTAFRVSLLGGEDVVTVSEGSVAVYRDGRESLPSRIDLVELEAAARAAAERAPEVSAQAPARIAAVSVHAGEQVSVNRRASAPVALEQVNVEHEQAWVAGWLTYEQRTIAEVAYEFNRRNRVKIVVEDPSVADHRLVFFRGRATDPESFTSALSATAGLRVVRDSPTQLRLLPKPAEAEIGLP